MITLDRIFHSAYVVEDIDAAAAGMTAALGIAFLEPVVREVPRLRDAAGDGPLTTRMTYSAAGPHHVELIQAAGKGLLSRASAGRTHHVGLWADDPAAASRLLQGQGYDWLADVHDDQGALAVAFVSRRGAVYELVRASRRPAWEDWIAGRATTHRIG